MSSKNWKPWWEKVADFDTAHEREEFMKGVSGYRTASVSVPTLLLGAIVGYAAGKASKTSKDKK